MDNTSRRASSGTHGQGFWANLKSMLELIFTKALVTPPFLALIVSYMGYNWGLHTLMSSGALFLTKVHHMSTSQVSLDFKS